MLNDNLQWLDHIPEGWSGLFTSLIRELEKLDPEVEVVQAKQKFGELRVYLKAGRTEAYDLIDAATRTSRTMCERCAASAKLRNVGGYYQTLCETHAKGAEPTEDQPILASFRISGARISPRKR
jgi:hypothetical protein